MMTAVAFPSFLNVSPFGPFCKDCLMPLAIEKGISSHGKACHPGDTIKNTSLVREVKLQMARLRNQHSRDFSSFLKPGSSGKEMWFCTCCFVAFAKFSNYKRHFESRCNKECVYVDDNKAFCYPTTCGRLGPKTCKLPVSVESPTLISEVTTISTLSQSRSSSDVLFCENRVPAALMITRDQAMAILKPFVRPDEDVKDLCLIFLPLLSADFEGTMKEYLQFSSRRLQDDAILSKWLKAGTLWLTKYASGHIANVPANVRHRLAEFEQQEVDETTYGTRTFTLRRGVPRLVSELQALLRFFYRYPTCLFDQFKNDEIQQIDEIEMIERAIIPRILYVATREATTDHGQLPIACRYCISRGFTIKNQVLVMNECGWFASRISAVLHLLRAGVCGYLVTLSVESACQNLTLHELEVVRSIQNGPVTNLLAPYVKQLREVNYRKPRIKDNTVNSNGDITSAAFTFQKTIWSTLIPRVVQISRDCFSEIFVGDTWTEFLAKPICVDNWAALEASVECDGRKVLLSDLTVNENMDGVLSRLQSVAELCLFGLGTGAVRHEEVVRLKVLSCQWHNSYLYYSTESLKQGSLKGTSRPKMVEHRLSLSISKIFLLLRYAFLASRSIEIDRLLPSLPGASMVDLLRDIFDLDYSPQLLNARHFFTSVGNILLPETSSTGGCHTIVSTTLMTEKSGHTQGTGRSAYGTYLENSEEMLYDVYHKSLGEATMDPPVLSFSPYSDCILRQAIKELLGNNADFRSRQQEKMINFVANSITRHSYIGIPCGHGKSLSWLVP